MNINPAEYLAIGFPLITGAVLAAFFPIRLKDYFVEGEIQQLGHGLTPYKFRAKHYIGIFIIYILSAAFLSLIQAYLLWDIASSPDLRFAYRFTDYVLYPVFPSALMAVLLMLFVFSYKYARKGEDDVIITKYSLLQGRNTLEVIDKIIDVYEKTSGGPVDTAFEREGVDKFRVMWGTFVSGKN